MDSSLHLTAAPSIDVTEAFSVPTAALTPSQYAHTVCMHPFKPLVAVGAGTSLAVYDLVSCTRLHRLDMRGVICRMEFSPDGTTLVLVMQDWVIFGWSLATARAHLLVPKREKSDKPLEDCLLAVGGGPRASIFFCRYGKESIRRSQITPGEVLDAKGRPIKAKEGSWGIKVRLEPTKAIIGLALPANSTILLVLHSDGELRGYNTTTASTEGLQPMFTTRVQEPVSKGLPPPGTLIVVPHPTFPGQAMIIQAGRFSGVITLLTLTAITSAPTVMARARIPGGGVLLGTGILPDCHQLVAVVSSQPEGGRLRALSWAISPANEADMGAGLQLLKVNPVDFASLIDSRAHQQYALHAPALAGAPPPPALGMASQQTSAAGYYAQPMTAASPTAGMAGAGRGLGDGSGSASALLHSMWAPTPAWSNQITSAGVLAGGIAPVVNQVLFHNVLPVMALQMQPSAYVRNTPAYMQLTLNGASPDEYCQIRKLLSVPLISATSWDSPVSAGGAKASFAAQHSTLQHWTPTTGHSTHTSSTPLASPTPKPTSALSKSPTPTKSPTPSQFKSPATPHLSLPGSFYYISDSVLNRFSLATKVTVSVATIPEVSRKGPRRLVHSMVYSKAGAWLIFFENQGVGQNAPDRWQWTVIHAADTTAAVWLKPGKYGAFIGAREEQFAVVDASGRLAAVFSLDTCQEAGAVPDYLYTLDGLSAGGQSLPVFPGPARDPVRDPKNSAVIGCVMWQSTAGGLAARPLPAVLPAYSTPAYAPTPTASAPRAAKAAPGYSTLGLTFDNDNDNDSDASSDPGAALPLEGEGGSEDGSVKGDEEPLGTGAVAYGSNLGTLGPKYWMPLQPGELVLQVAWQSLSWDPAGAFENDDDDNTEQQPSQATAAATPDPHDTPPMSPSKTEKKKAHAGGHKARAKGGPAMAAVLTNQRILMVTEVLHIHCAVSLSDQLSGALPCPCTSVLWAGPALLALLLDGRVIQVTWGGAVHPVCSIAPDTHSAIVGATPDSLILLRPVEMKRPGVPCWDVVYRPVNLLQPLVLGWASLGGLASTSAGLACAAACRSVLKTLVEHSDPTAVTPSVVWALLGTCALDLGYALVSTSDTPEPQTYLAATAAAGDWQAVERALAADLERAAHHPAPPPAGSAGHSKLLAAAAGAVAHGQMARAINLLQMAGEWRLAMVVAAASGNLSAAGSLAAKMSQSPTSQHMYQEAIAAQRMATALRSLYNSAVTPVHDTKLELVGPDGDACDPQPHQWRLGHVGDCIPAKTAPTDTQGLRDQKGEAIASAPREQILVDALALDPATRVALSLRAASVSVDGSAMPGRPSLAGSSSFARRSTRNDTLGPKDSIGGSVIAPSVVVPGMSPLDELFGTDLVSAPSQTTRAAGSDDDSDSDTSASPSPAQQWKGKVQIKDKASAPTAGADELRTAVAALRLAPPGTTTSTSGALPGMDSLGLYPLPSTQPTNPPPLTTEMSSGLSMFAGPSAAQTPSKAPGQVQQGGAGASPGGAFTGLSPALAAGMSVPAPGTPTASRAAPASPAAAFQALSPALMAGMAAAPAAPPAAAPAAAGSTAAAFQGLSPALAAGMVAPAPAAPAAANPAFAGLSPALAAGMVSAAAPAAPAAAPAVAAAAVPTGNPDTLYHEGVGLLEQGQFAAAQAKFAGALVSLRQVPASDVQKMKTAFCAQYLAAAQLLGAAAAGSGPREARLYRHAAALELDPRHRVPLAKESVARNRIQRNFRYCGDTLMGLVTLLLSGPVADGALQPLQDAIAACEKEGNSNADVPSGENLEAFARTVAACTAPEDVARALAPVMA